MNRQMVKVENTKAVEKASSPKVIEIHSLVQKPIKLNAILVSLIILALIILAMLPVRTVTNLTYGWHYDRPLIVWAADQVVEHLFIWDPAQVR